MTRTNEELTELLENLHFIANEPTTHNYIRLLAGLSLETITELLEEIEQLKKAQG